MDILRQLFREDEIERLMEKNPYIKLQTKENLGRILKLLADQKCNPKVLRNIIETNPNVLSRNPDELEELIFKCKEYNLLHLEKIFDEYPPLTSKNAYELDLYFYQKTRNKKSLEEAEEELKKEPFRIDLEMTNQ